MQFRLITAILASAAVSGVAAGSIQARQEGGDSPVGAAVDTASSLAQTTPPESGPGGSGSGVGGFDISQIANQAAQGAVPEGAVPEGVDASKFAFPGLGDGGININVTPPPPGTFPPNPPNNNYYYCQQNPWAVGCPGYVYPPYPRPQLQPSYCDSYQNCYAWNCNNPTRDYYTGRFTCAPVTWGAPACPCTYY